MKKHSAQEAENATLYHSEISKSFKDNYNRCERFRERKELFIQKAINFLPDSNQILDLGCGPGVIAIALAEKGFNVIGVDGSKEMINIALSNRLNIKNPLFIQKDIPFKAEELNQQFDAVISSSVLEYLVEYDKTILLIRDLLKDKGIFIASIPNRKSLFRKFERLIFQIIKKPIYLNFVKNIQSRENFIASTVNCGFVCLECTYFAIKGPIFRVLDKFMPVQYTRNMLICVFRKTSRTSKYIL